MREKKIKAGKRKKREEGRKAGLSCERPQTFAKFNRIALENLNHLKIASSKVTGGHRGYLGLKYT